MKGGWSDMITRSVLLMFVSTSLWLVCNMSETSYEYAKYLPSASLLLIQCFMKNIAAIESTQNICRLFHYHFPSGQQLYVTSVAEIPAFCQELGRQFPPTTFKANITRSRALTIDRNWCCLLGAVSELHSECNKTSHPSSGGFWQVINEACGLALFWGNTTPCLLANSGRLWPDTCSRLSSFMH